MPRATPAVTTQLALTPAAAAALSTAADPAAAACDLLGLTPVPRGPTGRRVTTGLSGSAPRLTLRLTPAESGDLPHAAGPLLSALATGSGHGPVAVPAELLRRVRSLCPGPIEGAVVAMVLREVERLEGVVGKV